MLIDFARSPESARLFFNGVAQDWLSSLQDFLQHDLPRLIVLLIFAWMLIAMVNVLTRRTELSIPPHVTFKEMKGASLFAGRTILSGSGDELVDLARDNLR